MLILLTSLSYSSYNQPHQEPKSPTIIELQNQVIKLNTEIKKSHAMVQILILASQQQQVTNQQNALSKPNKQEKPSSPFETLSTKLALRKEKCILMQLLQKKSQTQIDILLKKQEQSDAFNAVRDLELATLEKKLERLADYFNKASKL